MSMQVISRSGPVTVTDRRGVSRGRGRAWILDAATHAETWDRAHAELEADGPVELRRRATAIFYSTEPTVADFVSAQPAGGPDEWEAGFRSEHLVAWHRLLMAPHVRPTPAFDCPAAVKDHLPALGWEPSAARQLAWGRELHELAATYGHAPGATALAAARQLGNKGWLSPDDVTALQDALATLDPAVFRRAQDLVPMVEDAWGVLDAARAMGPDEVLLLVCP